MSAVPVLGTEGNPAPQNPENKATTNLIVNYLPQSMSEDEFKALFSVIGHVDSCKLIKDKASGVSLGYGFINFRSELDAQKAIEHFNGHTMESKTLKVSYARPSSSAIKNANVYIANLPKTFTQEELESLFRPYGTIITSKILVDPATSLGRGVGFVRFDKYAEAESAIQSMNGQQLPGAPQPIVVKFASPPKVTAPNNGSSIATHTTPPTVGTKRTTNPYLGGSVGPMRHTATVSSMRFNPVSALTIPSNAAASMVAAATPIVPTAGISQVSGNWCLFVYNIPETANDSFLYSRFSPYGAISSVNIIRDETSKCKGYGFVNMVNYEEAYNAICKLNGQPVVENGKQLQVSFKKPNK